MWDGPRLDRTFPSGTRPGGQPRPQRNSVPFVSGRVRITRNATAAPTATYQKYRPDNPAPDSAWITSGAVPPNSATVGLYQAPIPSPRSSVGNSSLMIAGAIDVIAV